MFIQEEATKNPAGSPHVEIDQQPAEDEFSRFEDLTRDLLRVPKKELDQKRSDA